GLAPRRPGWSHEAGRKRPAGRPRVRPATTEALAEGPRPGRPPRREGAGETAGGGAGGVRPAVGRRGGAAEEDPGEGEMTAVRRPEEQRPGGAPRNSRNSFPPPTRTATSASPCSVPPV